MRALLRRSSESTKFVLSDVEPRFGADVLSFGFTQDGGDFSRIVANDAAYLEAAFSNFARVAEEMVLQHAGERTVPWESALATFVDRVPDDIDWAIIGGTALAVRGVDVGPGDVDVITDIAGSQRMDGLFLDSLIDPTHEVPGFGWFGRAFPAARLEWLGNARDAPGVWSLGSVEWDAVEWRGHALRVPSLKVYLHIEESRGRTDRVEAIKRVMDRS